MKPTVFTVGFSVYVVSVSDDLGTGRCNIFAWFRETLPQNNCAIKIIKFDNKFIHLPNDVDHYIPIVNRVNEMTTISTAIQSNIFIASSMLILPHQYQDYIPDADRGFHTHD
jgi:hypothetical protein